MTDHCCSHEKSKGAKKMQAPERFMDHLREMTEASKALSSLPMRNIQKRLLHPGRLPTADSCQAAGGGFEYPQETKFTFHYQIKVAASPDKVLDDTKKYGRTMELYSGKQFQLDVSA